MATGRNGGRSAGSLNLAIRNWSIASLCFSLLVFVLGPAAWALGYWIELALSWPLLPIAGVICGRVALKRIAAGQESAVRFKRFAEVGKAIGYILLVGWILFMTVTILIYATMPGPLFSN